MRDRLARLSVPLLLGLLPLLLVGPALLPGMRFLPQLPVALEPLAAEHPAAAERAREGANRWTSDGLFPVLDEQFAVAMQVGAGTLPTWDRLSGVGQPLAAGTLSGTWYPPNWLGWLLSPDRAAGWLAAGRLALAGLGMWLFLRARGLPLGARLVGALAFQAGGFALVNLHYGMKLDAALWLPWSLWAIEGMRAGRRAAPLALCLSTALSFLAGFPPIAIFCALAAAAWAAARWLVHDTRGGRGSMLVRPLAFIGLGVLAAGVQLLPTFELSRLSTRGPRSAAELAAEAPPPAALATLVAPQLFGSQQEDVFPPHEPVAWWLTSASDAERAERCTPLEWSFYAGVAAVALSVAGLLSRRRERWIPALGLLACVAFALGWPGARLLYQVPGLNLGAPTRVLAVAWALWPWLAALGAEALLEGRARARRAALAFLVLALAPGAWLGLAIEPGAWAADVEVLLAERHGCTLEEVRALVSPEGALAAGERLVVVGRALLASALAAGIAVLALDRLRRRGARPLALLAPLLAVLLAEGALQGAPHAGARELGDLTLIPPSRAMQEVCDAANRGRVLRLDASESGVGEVLHLARPNLPRLYRTADLTPYTAYPSRRLVELMEALDPASRYRSGVSRLSSVELLGHPLLDLLRVSAVLSLRAVEHPRLELRHADPPFHVYDRSGALPPARLVETGIATPTDRAAIGLLAQGAIDPTEATVLAPGVAARRAPGGSGEAAELKFRWVDYHRFDVEVTGGRGGWLVFHGASHPGWKATVDGRDATFVRTDHVYRALWLEPGDRVVRTKYEPWSLRIGAGCTLLGLILGIGLVLRAGRRAAG